MCGHVMHVAFFSNVFRSILFLHTNFCQITEHIM
uniref:Uncharacterized protein n=1 Tax=Arundo donax TaxID=35708 RepID=A0A0A8ZDI4_ARUDO